MGLLDIFKKAPDETPPPAIEVVGTLTREQILGSPIKRVQYAYRMNGTQGWLDDGCAYFTVESGVSFVLPPSGGHSVEAVKPPFKAKDLAKDERRQLVGRTIIEIHRRLFEGEGSGDSCVLELDDGTFVTETIMAPHGTGGVGLWVYTDEWAAELAEEDESFSMPPFWKVET